MIKVLMTDDHKILRERLKRMLDDSGDITVVAEAGSSMELFAQLTVAPCDVIVLDISLPGGSGLDALKQLREDYPAIPVLILSMHPEDEFALCAIRSGAVGYLSKETAADHLVQAIKTVHAGGTFISASLAAKLSAQ